MSKHTLGSIRAANLIKEMMNAGNESVKDIASIIDEQTAAPDCYEELCAADRIIKRLVKLFKLYAPPGNPEDKSELPRLRKKQRTAAIAKATESEAANG